MEDLIKCPNCKRDDITGGIGDWTFAICGVALKATYITYKCEDCSLRFVDNKGVQVQKAAYAKWLKTHEKAAGGEASCTNCGIATIRQKHLVSEKAG